MKYSDEQLKSIAKNLSQVNSRAINILEVIKNKSGIKHGQIFTETQLSKFVTDKCITAFLVCGFIEKDINGQNLSYILTESGERFLNLEEGNR